MICDIDVNVVEQRLSDECGCPEEELEIGMCYMIVHLEEDGSGHMFLDMGDWEDEKFVQCDGTINGLRQKAKEWAIELHNKNEMM
jgi:hypothetical protein